MSVLSKENIENIFGLSPMQQGMLVHYARQHDSTAYMEQFDFVLSGQIDHACLQTSLDLLVNKYATLRTLFSYRKADEPRQIVLRQVQVPLDRHAFDCATDAGFAREVARFKATDKRSGFDLSKDILFRVALLENRAGQLHLIVTFHHIILDGWCLGLVFGDLFAFYDALVKQKNHGAPAIAAHLLKEACPYADFIRWLGGRNQQAASDWWRNYLNDYGAEVGLPWFDIKPEKALPASPATFAFSLGASLCASLAQVAKNHQLTFGSLFQTAWGVLLQKFNHSADVVFGSVVSGRPPALPGVEGMVGLFINTLPLRVTSLAGDTLVTLAKRVNQQVFLASEHEYFPLYEIQKLTPLKTGLFNHILAFENYPIAERMKAMAGSDAPLRVQDVRVEEQTNYDFNLIVNPGAEVKITFSYNANRFNLAQMQLLQRSLHTVLQQMATTPDMPVDRVSVCADVEREQILRDWNPPRSDFPADQTVAALFEAAVARFGDRVALVGPGECHTYQQLRQKVLTLALHLQQQGVKPGATLAIMLPRCPDTVVAILATLYCGATYVPLDLATPPERIAFIVTDCALELVITHSALAPLFTDLASNPAANSVASPAENSVASVASSPTGPAMKTVCLDQPIVARPASAAPASSSLPPFPLSVPVTSAVYIMYTSGSTGQPKGCAVSHQNIARLVKNTGFMPLDEWQTMVSTSSPVFDASTFEYWGTLTNGGKLAMFPNSDILDPARLKNLLREQQATILWITSAFFNQVVDADLSVFAPLAHVIFGGEVLSVTHVRRFLAAHPQVRLVAAYGPTENTTFSTTYPISLPIHYRLPLGKPISNSTCYVLDAQLNLLPPGAYGELCVGGAGVALGYVNRAELTEQVFVANPFVPGERLYRSGDIGRWLPDGNLDFLGRRDFQHKIRGFRVELGEIEAAIAAIAGVRESIVQVVEHPESGKQLHAWYVSEPGAGCDEAMIRHELGQRLPGYMVPSHLMRLDRFPLNISGKVDRPKLPAIVASASASLACAPVAPRSVREAQILATFAAVLGAPPENLSVLEPFAELGTNSLNLITINNRLKKALEREIPLQLLFAHDTIAKLALALENIAQSDALLQAPLLPLPQQESYPVSDSQKRIIVMGKLDGGGTSYNVPNVYRLDGPVDIGKLTQAISRLIARHESLRTRFGMDGGVFYQCIESDCPFELGVAPLLDAEFPEPQLAELIAPFDVGRAPLLRVHLLCQPDAVQSALDAVSYLFIDLHHAVVDGVSLGILMHELAVLYADPDAPLPANTVFPKEYTAWLSDFLQTERARRSSQYWLTRLGGELPVLELPTDFPRPAYQNFAGAVCSFRLDPELSAQLRDSARERGISLYALMLASVGLLLGKLSGQNDIIIGSPVAGRLHADVERVVGMFVNTLPMRLDCSAHQTLDAYLQQVASDSQEALAHADCQFNTLVEQLQIGRDTSRNPVFDVMFAWENIELAFPNLGQAKVSNYVLSKRVAKFDLDIICIEQDGCICGLWEYATALFSEASIRRFIAMHEALLRQMVAGGAAAHASAHPSASAPLTLSGLTLVDAHERALILQQFNRPARPIDPHSSVLARFMQQVESTPDAIALIGRDQPAQSGARVDWRYRDLAARADRIAAGLLAHGVQPGERVLIHAGRGVHYVLAMLGILRAGAVYVPVDPKYPAERKHFIARDSMARCILVGPRMVGSRLVGPDQVESDINGLPVLEIDALLADSAAQGTLPPTPSLPSPPPTMAHDPCYIMYTSGTTGNPKGVLVPHIGIIRLVVESELIDIEPHDRLLLSGAVGFDSVTWEIWHALLNGLTLCTVDDATLLNPAKFAAFCREHGVNVCFLTTGLFHEFVRTDPATFAPLRLLITGGDVVSPKYAAKLLEHSPHLKLYNAYGPTEGTVYSSIHKIGVPVASPIPIGKPVANTRIYVLDSALQMVPVGVKGQLCIAGDGLALEYVNNPVASAEKFVACPFEPGQKMYLSGDIAMWRIDGTLAFFGRNDGQIKLRGYRIELTEIEQALTRINGIEVAHVMLRGEGSDKKIVAWVTSTLPTDSATLRAALAHTLPDHMVPATVMVVGQMPINRNGKVDRHALPEPVFTLVAPQAAATDVEKILLTIWQKVLQSDALGTTDNFFEQGGDSIKAIQIISELANAGLELEIPTLFTHPTVQQLAPKIGSKRVFAEQSAVTGAAPLTPIQHEYLRQVPGQGQVPGQVPGQRQWQGQAHYLNQAMCLTTRHRLDPTHLRDALQALVVQHDALRLRLVPNQAGGWGQYFGQQDDDGAYRFESIDMADQPGADEDTVLQQLGQRFQTSIDIVHGPVIQLGHLKGRDGDYLLFVLAHFVEDGVSLRILQQDFVSAWQQRQGQQTGQQSGQPIRLGLKTDSAKAWAHALVAYRDSPELAQEIDWWREIDAKRQPYWPRIGNVPRRMAQMQSHTFALDQDTTVQLLTRANAAFATQTEDILVASLVQTLGEQFGSGDYCIDFEGHGREPIGQRIDLSRTVGWFTSLYPVCFHAHSARQSSDALRYARDCLRHVPNKGIGYGVLKYLGQPVEGIGGAASDICFNYLGVFDAAKADAELAYVDKDIGPLWGEQYQSQSPLLINAMVSNHTLSIRLLSHPAELDQEQVRQFGAHWLARLQAMIALCVATEPASAQAAGSVTEVYGEAAPAPMQSLLLHNISLKNLGKFNAASVYRIDQPLALADVNSVFGHLLEHHDALRMVFRSRPGGHVQYNQRSSESGPFACEQRSITDPAQLPALAGDWFKQGFDLQQDRLLRVLLVNQHAAGTGGGAGTGPAWLCIMVSHMIFDIISERILMTDFVTAWQQLVAGQAIALPPKSDTYIRWCNRLDVHFRQMPESIRRFWLDYLNQALGHTLPVEKKNLLWWRKKPQLRAVAIAKPKLDQLVAALRRHWSAVGDSNALVSTHDILFSLFGLALRSWKNREQTVFMMNTHGRQGHLLGMDINRCVGFFMTAFPFLLDLGGKQDFSDIVRQVQRDFQRASQTSLYFLPVLARHKDAFKKKMDGMVGFNYQGEIPQQPLLHRMTDELVANGIITPEQEVSTQNRLTMALRIINDELIVEAQYSASDYDDASIDRLLAAFQGALDQVLGQYRAGEVAL